MKKNPGLMARRSKVMSLFCSIQNFGVFKNMHFTTFFSECFKTNGCFVILRIQLFKIAQTLKFISKQLCDKGRKILGDAVQSFFL